MEQVNETLEETIEVNENETNDDIYGDDELFSINSWGADLSFRELANMYDEDELLKPELQRNYVWDKREASRFVESILLGLPVPSIFLAKTVDENYLIIDGYQRIMTVYDFIFGVFTKDGSVFKLTSNVNKKWKNSTFKQLSITEQKRIKRTTIHSIIFEQKKPEYDDTSMYQIFERINTGGRSLSPQEIRNCVYHNKLNKLLFDLNDLKQWRSLFGQQNKEPRMKDMEYILRYLMFSNKEFIDTTAISLKKELNLFMDLNQNPVNDDKLESYKKQFTKTMDTLYKITPTVFENINSEGSTMGRFHPTIFDSIAVATTKAIAAGISIPWLGNFEEFNRRKKLLVKDENFEEYTTIRTTNTKHITGRIDLAYKYLFEEV
ncbi:hypothetical protein A5819_001585 [Enterococcus sp. 7E2_DIV0204]|uniref:DUF262 domain-containing protein n=1 Tax=Enterococcus sp. 7E2_DIV0204 TaxID=1834188 RepID=UPI000A356AA5|nr:DUF262 domain-containing protein [Enterococcus sp. 7E2_DIV0204]OTN89093.1 hypothetical protein A5819_001585 [Enterococcus sp. 7E2_DIV0204]